MDPVHLHLMVNHLPVVGPVLAIPLLVLALALRDQQGLLLGAAVVLSIAAIGGLAAERTGGAAEHALEDRLSLDEDLVEAHEHRAEGAVAILFAAAVGAVALAVYEQSGGRGAPRWLVALVLAGTVAGAGATGWTAQAGGWIRHPELRPGGLPAPASEPAAER